MVADRTRRPLISVTLLLAFVLVPALALVACANGAQQGDTTASTISASVLVEASAEDPRWYRDVEVPAGTDGYELLVAATDGAVEADWHAEFQSHFVRSILGAEPQGQEFWGVFLWNEPNGSWEPLPFGADWLSVKEGHIIGWALVEYSPDTHQLPVSAP